MIHLLFLESTCCLAVNSSFVSFSFIFQTNPPVLTLVSCVILAFVLIDLLVPMAVRALFKNENWFVCFFKLEMQNNSI